MVAFPANPTTGQQFLNWTWDGIKWAASPTALPECGRFGIVGSSPSNSVRLSPYKGDLIKLNGAIRQIPAAGITAVANSCYVNGSLAALNASQWYYVYLWDNAGVLTLDFSATGHATSATPGNVGVEIKSGDDTRTLVGILWTNSSTPTSNSFMDAPANRQVRSWFNRRRVDLYVPVTWGPSGTVGTWGGIGGSAANFVAFSDDAVSVAHGGYTFSNVADTNGFQGVAIDNGAAQGYFSAFMYNPANTGFTTSGAFTTSGVAEGAVHFAIGVQYAIAGAGGMSGVTATIGTIG